MTTNKEIIKKHSLNPMSAVEQLDCSLDTLMDEARANTENQIFAELNIFISKFPTALTDGYHNRKDYPPFAITSRDDRNRYREYVKRVLDDEYQNFKKKYKVD